MQVELIKNRKIHYLEADESSNFMDVLAKAGMITSSDCAGRGSCGKCRVKVLSGRLSDATVAERKHYSQDELNEGWVLACQRFITEDISIEIPSNEEAVERKVALQSIAREAFSDPNVEKVFLTLETPDLADQEPDIERLLMGVHGNKSVPSCLLNRLPEILRSSSFSVTATLVDNTVIEVEQGDTHDEAYGFVVDIGTTTLAVYLVDLNNGAVISARAETNPQGAFGADVVTRIGAVVEDFCFLNELHLTLIETLSDAMRQLLTEHALEEKNVYAAAVVGNTAMSHLFLEADPRNLAKAPFTPCYRGEIVVKGNELGLPMHPEGSVMVLPNIAGYVGSDTMGVILSTKIYAEKGYTLAVDIGTNGEIVLAGDGRFLTCSTAAGPAFEGAQIQDGMRAGEGAIEEVRICNGELQIKVIGNTVPKGLCGSGIIDVIAELFRTGLINSRGKLISEDTDLQIEDTLRLRLRQRDSMKEFVLVFKNELGNERDIVITQKDIRELQLAKGAVAAGIKILAKEMGISTEQIHQVFLAGAFGNYINTTNAVALGLFPEIEVDKIIAVGNAAGEGARMVLLSSQQRRLAARLSKEVQHIELSTHEAFYEHFMKEINLPK